MSFVPAIALALILVYSVLLLALRDPGRSLRFDFDDLRRQPLRFRGDFLWGTATSAHQIEGNCSNNNWHRFEHASDSTGRPHISRNQSAGSACDHWKRVEEDIGLMKDLALNAYRFSVEWSKIEPSAGVFDEIALRHYADEVRSLRAAGIEPMVTLHHFTDPAWFEDRGAFLRDDGPELFARFVTKVVGTLGDSVKLWCTVNEPSVYAVNGYVTGEFPPGVRDPVKAVKVLRNLLRAHSAAFRAIKAVDPSLLAGPAINIFLFDPPSGWNLVDVAFARNLSRNFNHALLRYLTHGRFDFSMPFIVAERFQDQTAESFDFIGLNYYTRLYERLTLLRKERILTLSRAPRERITDMGWEIYPEGLYRALRLIRSHTTKPVYITENGIADRTDGRRTRFIEDHLLVLNRALAEGIDVRGYFYWTLMDNFEWAHGYDKKFGLYSVDFATQQRVLRDGGRGYRDFIRRSEHGQQSTVPA